MVDLVVVHDYEVYVAEVDFAFQTAYELFVERLPDRIYSAVFKRWIRTTFCVGIFV